jgi:hypothetical protein
MPMGYKPTGDRREIRRWLRMTIQKSHALTKQTEVRTPFVRVVQHEVQSIRAHSCVNAPLAECVYPSVFQNFPNHPQTLRLISF